MSETNLPQDGVEYSTFTCHPAAILLPRLRLSTGLVRGLSVFCSWAYFQLRIWILLLRWTTPWLQSSLSIVIGALDKLLLTMFKRMHCRKLPRQASWHSRLSPLLGFVISTITMWASAKLLPCCGSSDLLDLLPWKLIVHLFASALSCHSSHNKEEITDKSTGEINLFS